LRESLRNHLQCRKSPAGTTFEGLADVSTQLCLTETTGLSGHSLDQRFVSAILLMLSLPWVVVYVASAHGLGALALWMTFGAILLHRSPDRGASARALPGKSRLRLASSSSAERGGEPVAGRSTIE